MYILNRQTAARIEHAHNITQFKTHNYWLVVYRGLCVKVVGATAGDGFPVVFKLHFLVEFGTVFKNHNPLVIFNANFVSQYDI